MTRPATFACSFGLLAFLLTSTVFILGCSGAPSNNTQTPPAITVAVSPNTTALGAGGTQAFTASIANDSTNAGVTWSIGSGAGTLSATTTSGVTYTAPSAIATQATVTLTATSKTDTTKSSTASITLNPITVAISTTPISMASGATQTFVASVTNDAAAGGVNWTVTSGGGSFNPAHTTSGGTTMYTAASPVTAASAVLTATSATDSTKSMSVTVRLAAVSVTIPTSPTTIAGAATEALTATVANDFASAGVTWSITSGGGSLTSVTTSGVTYNAPLPVTTTTAVIKATSKTDTSKTASITIPLTPISLGAISPATITLGNSATQVFAETVSADSSNSGVTWSIGAGAGTLSGVTTTGVTYNAPTTAISATTNVTLTATSVKDPTKTATATITLSPLSVSISTTPLTADAGQQNYVNSSLANDSSGSGVTYSVTAGGGGFGNASPGVSPYVVTGNGPFNNQVFYYAPATVATSTTATITVTSVKDPSKSASIQVTLNPAMLVTPGNHGATAVLTAAQANTTYTQAFSINTGTGTPPFTNVQASGGTGLPPGITLNAPTGTLSGTPTTPGTYTFNLTFKDSATNTAILINNYSLTVNVAPLIITTTSLPNGNVGNAYSTQLVSTGGTGTVTWLQTGGTLPTGLSLSASGLISGTPSVTATATSLTFKATDSATTPQTQSVVLPLTIGAATTFTVGGTVSSTNCNTGLSGITVSINTAPVQTTTTNSSGDYSFANIPNGTYTLTPSITGPSSIFFPATQSAVVSGAALTENFSVNLGYTVSGTASYAGSQTGAIRIALNGGSCGGGGNGAWGTALTAAGAYTIRGVPPGTYSVSAFIDNLGKGAANVSNPSGTGSNVTITTANATGANVILTDPTAATPVAPSIQAVSPFNTGVLLFYDPSSNSNNVEVDTSYTLQWSTSPTFATVTGSKTFSAIGPNGATIWLVNGLTDGNVFYFRAYGNVGATVSTSASTIMGPVTIGAPATGNTVSGAVTFGTPTASAPLYVGFFDQTLGKFYGHYYAAPVSSPVAYTVQVPTGSNYLFIAILDQNNNGLIDTGDFSDTNGVIPTVSFAGNTTGQNLTLPTSNAAITVITSNNRSVFNGNVTSQVYGLTLAIDPAVKIPTNATIVSGPNVIHPIDIGACNGCGISLRNSPVLATAAPTIGDSYGIQITYSDGTSETLNAVVNSVITALPSNLSPQTGTSSSTQPNFSWTPNLTGSNYTYSFGIYDTTANNNFVQIPGNNSNSSGFGITSAGTYTLAWQSDPSGSGIANNWGGSSSSSLDTTHTYSWQVQVMDSNGNTGTTMTTYQP